MMMSPGSLPNFRNEKWGTNVKINPKRIKMAPVKMKTSPI
jgi:hypothetical protein